jgi:hypothetical protein
MKVVYYYPSENEVFWAHYNFIKDPFFLKELKNQNFKLEPFSPEVNLNYGDILFVFEAKNLLPNFKIFLRLSLLNQLYFIYKYIFKKNFFVNTKKKNGKIVLIIFESKLHSPENHFKGLSGVCDRILTWNDELCCNKNFEKYLLPLPYEWPKVELTSFSEKKMLVNISANKYSRRFSEFYSKRREMILNAEKYFNDDFELYGFDWNKPVTFLQKKIPSILPFYKSYKGIVKDKSVVFSRFKFGLIYENSSVDGYITEKIFDCLRSNCVPVYLGASNIKDYIPSNVYIDCSNFKNSLELFKHLDSIGELRYNKYLNDISIYLQSEKFKLNLSPNFAQKLVSVIKELSK